MLNIENHFSNRNTCTLHEGHDFYIIRTIFIYTYVQARTHTHPYIYIYKYTSAWYFFFTTIETLLLLFNSESIEGIARLMMPISWATEQRTGRYTNTVMATAPGSHATHVEKNSTEEKKSDSLTVYTHLRTRCHMHTVFISIHAHALVVVRFILWPPQCAIPNFNSNFGSFELCKMDSDTDLYAWLNAKGENEKVRAGEEWKRGG
jgi:hypothetical protein